MRQEGGADPRPPWLRERVTRVGDLCQTGGMPTTPEIAAGTRW